MKITKLYYLKFNIITEVRDENKDVKNMKMLKHLQVHTKKVQRMIDTE